MDSPLDTAGFATQLREKASDTLDSIIERGARCALLDFPDHSNVGDNAIWLGELTYLRSRNVSVAHICGHRHYQSAVLRDALGKKGVIFLHGGGNFGDLYPAHQIFRELILRDFPAQKVVQMPQSICFLNDASLARCRASIAAHADFHLCVRDRASADFARRHFACRTYLCPDAALFLKIAPQHRQAKAAGIYVLSRTDKEMRPAPDGPISSTDNIRVGDWIEEPAVPGARSFYLWTQRQLRHPVKIIPTPVLALLSFYATISMAKARVKRGMALLDQARIVVTDRLHGVILASLCGKRVYYADTIQGKLSAFVETWFGDQAFPKRYPSLQEALQAATHDESARIAG